MLFDAGSCACTNGVGGRRVGWIVAGGWIDGDLVSDKSGVDEEERVGVEDGSDVSRGERLRE